MLTKLNQVFLSLTSLMNRHSVHVVHSIYFAGTRLVAIAAFILSVPFFIKLASHEEYGQIAVGFSLLGVGTVLDVGFGYVLIQSLGRRFARGNQPDVRKIKGLFSLYLLFALLLAMIGFFFVLILPLSLLEVVLYSSISLLLPALAISGMVAAIFQSQNKLKPINLSRFFFEISKSLALVLSAFFSQSAFWIGPILVLTTYIRAIIDRQHLAKITGVTLNIVSPQRAIRYWRLARHGAASFATVIITVMVTIGDKMLIKYFYDDSSVAYYSIAYDINTKVYLFIYAVNNAMFAVVLHRFARRISTRTPILIGIISVSLIALIFYLPLALWSEQILSFWVDSEFSERSAPLTTIMTGASLLYLYGNVFENGLIAMGRAKEVFSVYIFGIIVYVIALVIFINCFELNGFMYSYMAFCAALCSGFLFRYYSIDKNLKIKSCYEG